MPRASGPAASHLGEMSPGESETDVVQPGDHPGRATGGIDKGVLCTLENRPEKAISPHAPTGEAYNGHHINLHGRKKSCGKETRAT